jgi:hypothetical protein
MQIVMRDIKTLTLADIEAFLAGSQELDFSVKSAEGYKFIEGVLNNPNQATGQTSLDPLSPPGHSVTIAREGGSSAAPLPLHPNLGYQSKTKGQNRPQPDTSRFRLTPHWNHLPFLGSSRIGNKFHLQAHLRIGKC